MGTTCLLVGLRMGFNKWEYSGFRFGVQNEEEKSIWWFRFDVQNEEGKSIWYLLFEVRL